MNTAPADAAVPAWLLPLHIPQAHQAHQILTRGSPAATPNARLHYNAQSCVSNDTKCSVAWTQLSTSAAHHAAPAVPRPKGSHLPHGRRRRKAACNERVYCSAYQPKKGGPCQDSRVAGKGWLRPYVLPQSRQGCLLRRDMKKPRLEP